MNALFILLCLVGILSATIGGIVVLVEAFKVSVTWGLCYLFVPFAAVVFIFKYWDQTKKGVGMIAGGWLLLIIGVFNTENPHKKPSLETVEVAQASALSTPKRETKLIDSIKLDEPQASYVPAPPVRVEAAEEPEPEPVIAQVYVDPMTKRYWTEECKTRPAEATRLSKSVAQMQGYRPAKC
jgi:hypothetical protein